MKFEIKIPNSILKAICIIAVTVLFVLLVQAVIEFHVWLGTATCEDLIEKVSYNMDTLTKRSLEIKIVELECWK